MRPKKNREKRLLVVNKYFAAIEDGKLNAEKTFLSPCKKTLLELGCGKGSFAVQLSKNNPDANILAVEKVTDVLMMAMEKAKREECLNLKFANFDIETILSVIPEKFADAIYINFCDPWPRKKNAKRRLTSPLFLERYKKLMKDGARIYFKTDNLNLFEYSLETFIESGFTLKNVCFDLHGDDVLNEGNIQTEYEKTFSAKGFNINYLEAYLNNR
jgi:tRNA (guanine-N7-)-methyltransferase